jgi:hypothetical protein
VNTHLLDKIVERTRAASQFVLPEEDLEIKVSSFFTKIKEPLLTNVKLNWPEGVRVSKLYPKSTAGYVPRVISSCWPVAIAVRGKGISCSRVR